MFIHGAAYLGMVTCDAFDDQGEQHTVDQKYDNNWQQEAIVECLFVQPATIHSQIAIILYMQY